jgi:glucosamine 6-phosphate synthetase-like amidotransferase/phosphosugar isomerase protein
MCGVFGFVANRNNDKGPDIGLLAEIATVTMTRGNHAFGFAWVDRNGSMRMFKQQGRIVDHLGLLKMARGARMMIGHCRFTTMGSHFHNENNHPHPVNGGWLVHNGIVGTYHRLLKRYNLTPTTQCDSEVFGLLAERFDGPNCERLREAVLATEDRFLGPGHRLFGPDPAVVLGLWARPLRLTAIRRENPLHWGIRDGSVYMASLPGGLPGKVASVPNRMLVDFTNKGVRNEEF